MGLPGQWGGIVVAVCLALFAFSTILGWSYYGEKSLEYPLGTGAVLPYRVAFVLAAFLGSLGTVEFVWLLSDVLNGLMAIPNLIGLLCWCLGSSSARRGLTSGRTHKERWSDRSFLYQPK